jgi:hypothetical protein
MFGIHDTSTFLFKLDRFWVKIYPSRRKREKKAKAVVRRSELRRKRKKEKNETNQQELQREKGCAKVACGKWLKTQNPDNN